MTIPNLGGVITKADVDEKDGVSFKASYVAWAKTSQLLRDHAPGWFFYLAAKNEEYVWEAPDKTGYLMCFFENGEQRTPLFPFAIMDNRNNPVPLEKINARVLTDSHRRALCACAAFTFGLAYELWSEKERDEIAASATSANPKRDWRAQPKQKPPVKTDQTQELFLKALKSAKNADDLDRVRNQILSRHKEQKITDKERESLMEAFFNRETELIKKP